MDTGAKTLAQLSEEGKEKKYVTLDVGAKLSGYTKDYLDRLCRLGKVEYRIWNNGAFAIELESLLRETQAILLSYEGITFVDKSELTDPPDAPPPPSVSDQNESKSDSNSSPAFENGMAQAVPTFGETIASRSAPISYIGRAVVSDALHPEERPTPATDSPSPRSAEPPSPLAPLQPPQSSVPAPVQAPSITSAKSEEEPEARAEAGVVPIKFDLSRIRDPRQEASTDGERAERTAEHVPIAVINGGTVTLSSTKKDEAPSSPTPATDVEKARHIPIVKAETKEGNSGHTPVRPIPGQKVIVFDPKPKPLQPAAQTEHVAPSPSAPSGVGSPATPLAKAPSSVPASPQVAASIGIAPAKELPLLTDSPELNLPSTPPERPLSVPAPSLPMVAEEHHLATYEVHPLMRSTGFNAVFALMLIASSFMVLGGRVLENESGSSRAFVAGVGAAFPNEERGPSVGSDTDGTEKPASAMLPFSNDIVATSGKRENSVIIRPVSGGKEGKAYEYVLVPTSELSTTTDR